MFTAFGTHINLPFPLFSSSSKNIASVPTTTAARTVDLEKQDYILEEPPRALTTDKTVETNIWSGSIHEDEKEDPTSPKMGTRAYRERERRGKEKRESGEKEAMSRVVADNVCVNTSLPIQNQDGVAVRRDLVRKEEAADGTSTSFYRY